jgi:amino acid transporter
MFPLAFRAATRGGGLPIHHRIYLMAVAVMAFVLAPPVFALQQTDSTQDSSGGKTFTQMATDADNTRQLVTTLILGVFALFGIIMAGMSIMSLHRAAKEEREKPTGAVVGLICGGAMTMVSIIVWVIHNQLVQ